MPVCGSSYLVAPHRVTDRDASGVDRCHTCSHPPTSPALCKISRAAVNCCRVIDTEYFLVILGAHHQPSLISAGLLHSAGSIPAGRCLPSEKQHEKPNPASAAAIDPSIDAADFVLGASAVLISICFTMFCLA